MINWQKVKLGEIVKLQQGFALNKKSNHYLSQEKNGIPLLRISDLLNDTQSLFVKTNIPKQFIANENDIIYSRTGQVGHAFINKKGVVYNNCFKVIVDEKTDKNFLYFFLNTPDIRAVVKSLATGTAQPDLNHDAFKSVKINLPPLLTQQKIAKILSNYDDLIENNLKRIKLLEEYATLTYEEWFLRFRINGKKLDIDANNNLPFEWKKRSITKCDSFQQDKSKVTEFKGKKTYYATADIDGNAITDDGEIIDWNNKPSRAQIKPKNNTVWFARMSDTYKVLCFNNRNFDLQNNIVLSSGFAGFKAKNDLCLPFLYCTINSKFFHELKNLYATGATQVSLNNDSMNFIKITEPKLNLVERFGKITLPLIEEISVLRSKNELLKEARDILLPRLMTGMINTDEMDIAL